MKIVFMGTPAFAVPSLSCLLASPHDVAGVVTVPDKPSGRGQKLRMSQVKETALRFNLPIFQPGDLKEPIFVERLRELEADLFVVVAFRILPEIIFEMPPLGTVNLHSSLLPRHRGAAPINWAIINGDKQTGVSTIFIQKAVDTGDLIFQEAVDIDNRETAGELHDRLSEIGAKLLLKSVDAIAQGNTPRLRQSGKSSMAPKLTRELARIDWSKPAIEINNLIRGLSPVPGAFTIFSGRTLKLYRAEVCDPCGELQTPRPGEIALANPKDGTFVVGTGDGFLKLIEVQPEGKRRMTAREYLLGYKPREGEKFGQYQ